MLAHAARAKRPIVLRHFHRLGTGGVVHHRPRPLPGFGVKAGHIGGHKAAAAHNRAAHPAHIVGLGQAIDHQVFERTRFFGLV